MLKSGQGIRRRVLFLCTGNSARSQMAEAIAIARYGERWEAASAGTHPAGRVHPAALQVLAEIGIHHQGRSKNVAEFKDVQFDRVITVCDSAAEECPVWLGPGIRVHESFPDPARASGSQEEILAEFRRVRDAILESMPDLLGES